MVICLPMIDVEKVTRIISGYTIRKLQQERDGGIRFSIWTVDRRSRWSASGIHHFKIYGKIATAEDGCTVTVNVVPGLDSFFVFIVFFAALLFGILRRGSIVFCALGAVAILFLCGTAFFQGRNCLQAFLKKLT